MAMIDRNQVARQDSTLLCLILQGIERSASVSLLQEWEAKLTLPSSKGRATTLIAEYTIGSSV